MRGAETANREAMANGRTLERIRLFITVSTLGFATEIGLGKANKVTPGVGQAISGSTFPT
jgi:hypothetical protein